MSETERSGGRPGWPETERSGGRPGWPETERSGARPEWPGTERSAAARVDFVKGHGTQNDFVLLPDPGVALDLTPEFVSALCDRHRGIGADGVLRVATAGALRDAGVLVAVPDGISDNDWFMDYRNGDGSIAEMCGNGVRVFAHYLAAHDLVAGNEFVVGSRAGARPVVVHERNGTHAEVSVSMGKVVFGTDSKATVGGRTVAGVAVDVGNPHLACVIEGMTAADLEDVDLTAPISFDRGDFPAGVNIELITPPVPSTVDGVTGEVLMRVHERGVGETRSCGTGTVAAAAAALRSIGRTTGTIIVDVPGGRIIVTVGDDDSELRGPSILVGAGMLNEGWL
ncbi:diaminopimelate epimerase [Williamsia soli]|uniref:diaminopimelate epimerase n=1 Tax=Williamsia soli TaxID=364929 RepID=UPI001A9CF6CF|nr:diaminopimelate epimerase [Williamsia soli]